MKHKFHFMAKPRTKGQGNLCHANLCPTWDMNTTSEKDERKKNQQATYDIKFKSQKNYKRLDD